MTDTIRLVLEALTPIAHFDTRTGVDNGTNIRRHMTQPVLRNGRRVYIPHISENALRTTLLRVPLGNHLVRELRANAEIPRSVLNLLYSGGAMGGGAKAPGDETVIGHAVGDLYPATALMGGAVDSFILPRGKVRLSSWVVAQEYLPAIEALFPEEAETARAMSAIDMIGTEVRTRGTGDEAAGNQMLYNYDVLSAGSRIAIELTLDTWIKPVVRSAIGRALAEWDGFIGGQGRQGRGRCRIAWSDPLPSPDLYDAHVAEHAEAMRLGLTTGTLGAAKPLCAA